MQMNLQEPKATCMALQHPTSVLKAGGATLQTIVFVLMIYALRDPTVCIYCMRLYYFSDYLDCSAFLNTTSQPLLSLFKGQGTSL